jgi:hypothetical protein
MFREVFEQTGHGKAIERTQRGITVKCLRKLLGKTRKHASDIHRMCREYAEMGEGTACLSVMRTPESRWRGTDPEKEYGRCHELAHLRKRLECMGREMYLLNRFPFMPAGAIRSALKMLNRSGMNVKIQAAGRI